MQETIVSKPHLNGGFSLVEMLLTLCLMALFTSITIAPILAQNASALNSARDGGRLSGVRSIYWLKTELELSHSIAVSRNPDSARVNQIQFIGSAHDPTVDQIKRRPVRTYAVENLQSSRGTLFLRSTEGLLLGPFTQFTICGGFGNTPCDESEFGFNDSGGLNHRRVLLTVGISTKESDIPYIHKIAHSFSDLDPGTGMVKDTGYVVRSSQ